MPDNTKQQVQPEAGTWSIYVAGMVGAYLGWRVDDKRIAAVAGIIERRRKFDTGDAPPPVEDDARDAAQQREALLETAMDDREQTIAMIADRIVRTSPGIVRAGVTAAYDAGQAAERERCAKLCEQADKSTHPADLADAIRKA